jgi:hypothetical protein
MLPVNPNIPAQIQQSNRANGAKKVARTSNGKQANELKKTNQTPEVDKAISHSIRHMSEAEYQQAKVQYDLPEGRSRKALDEYMKVMNNARREELAQMLGVDIFI